MGQKVKVEIEKLEDGYLATVKHKRIGNDKVSSDTLENLLKKVVVRVGKVYKEQIFAKDILDEE